MHLRTFGIAGTVAMAVFGLTAPTAQAAETDPPPSSAVVEVEPGTATVLVRRPAEAAEAPGEWMKCWIQQEGGAPHIRTSTGGAGVKAALMCEKPVLGMALQGQMYYYWGGWKPSPNGSPAVTKAANTTRLQNYDTTSPKCANANPTWWYGEFNGNYTLRSADGGTVTEKLALTSSERELACGPA